MAGDERSHQVTAGAMQGDNCFLCFHFPPLSETKSASQNTASECERVSFCRLSGDIFDGRGNQGHAEIVIRGVRGHAEAEGLNWNCPVFVAMLRAPASLLL